MELPLESINQVVNQPAATSVVEDRASLSASLSVARSECRSRDEALNAQRAQFELDRQRESRAAECAAAAAVRSDG